MCDSECMPQDDISIVKILVRIGLDPGGNALGWLARGLGNVTACWMELCIIVCSKSAHVPTHSIQRNLHFVTCTACLAKPALFHTKLPGFGSRSGTSLLTSL